MAAPEQMELRRKESMREGWGDRGGVKGGQAPGFRVAEKPEEMQEPKPTPNGVMALKRHRSSACWKENGGEDR